MVQEASVVAAFLADFEGPARMAAAPLAEGAEAAVARSEAEMVAVAEAEPKVEAA